MTSCVVILVFVDEFYSKIEICTGMADRSIDPVNLCVKTIL